MLQPQRQRTVFLIISVLRITSLLEWTVTKCKSVQCSRNCNELCYTFNECFPDDFLMHSNVEYQCSIPCKYMNGSFLSLHMQSIWTMFGTNNNSDKVSKWEYMESQKRKTEYPRLTMDIQHSTTDTHNAMMDHVRMLIPFSRWSWIFVCHSVMQQRMIIDIHDYLWIPINQLHLFHN